MHAAVQFIVLWVLAFVTLSAALVLLTIYYSVIGNDLVLRTLSQEALVAGVASLIEGAGAWVVISFIPAAARAMFVPALIVAILYKCAHLEDWSRYDLILLLLFQMVITAVGGCVYFGHFQAAIIILAFFGVFLAILGSIVRSL
jgi:hypothetical protein